MKVHLHSDQFDGHPHSQCGKGDRGAVSEETFEATEERLRCAACDRYWFPNGQPEWHLRAAQKRLEEKKVKTLPQK